MTIEEKAKAYDNALEKARSFELPEYRRIMKELFPELRESEDEKVRKEIISFLKDHIDDINLQVSGDYDTRDKEDIALQEWCKRVITWLEKQSEQKSIWHNEYEEPQRDSLILLIMQSGTPIVAKIIEPNHTFNHGEKWAYIDDLLEKGEQESDPREENLEELLAADDIYQMAMNDDMVQEAKTKAINALSELQIGKLLGLENQDEQKPTDNNEQKFHEGEWITNGDYTWKIVEIEPLDYILQSQEGNIVDDTISHVDEQFHSFTIEDAKEGDVLADKYSNVGVYQGDKNAVTWNSYCYCGVNKRFYSEGCHEFPCYPATKEQRDQLEKAMADAGYTFDFGKKELKKIEKKSQRMVSVEVKEALYDKPTDEEMKELLRTEYEKGRADTLSEMKSSWSEEDEKMFRSLHNLIYVVRDCDCDSRKKKEYSDWVESLKGRYQPKQEQEWSKEDEKCIRLSTNIIDSALRAGFCVQLDRDRCVDWLESLKDRVLPRPKQEWSEEDEKSYVSILNDLKQNVIPDEDNINWLKSIKQRLDSEK